MRGHVAEAGHLRLLRGQVHDRVEDEVCDAEAAVRLRCREVAYGDADGRTARLCSQPGHHRPRQVDPVYRDAAGRQWQRDSSGSDAELESPATSG